MKTWWIFLPLLALLSGCTSGADGMQQALDYRTSLMEAGTCAYETAVTADLGDSIYQFDMEWDYEVADKAAHLTVLSPTEIQGISATVSGDSAQLSFEDVALEISTEVSGNLPPLTAPKILGDAWVAGFIQWATVEEEVVTVQYILEKPLDLWVMTQFDGNMVPQYAEIFQGGARILSVEFLTE